jgi:hypothetical protein
MDLPPLPRVEKIANPKAADGVSLFIEMTGGKRKERRGRDFPVRKTAFA